MNYFPLFFLCGTSICHSTNLLVFIHLLLHKKKKIDKWKTKNENRIITRAYKLISHVHRDSDSIEKSI